MNCGGLPGDPAQDSGQDPAQDPFGRETLPNEVLEVWPGSFAQDPAQDRSSKESANGVLEVCPGSPAQDPGRVG